MKLDALKKHIEEKLHAAELVRYPFPHLIIENFFPDDIYQEILLKNPFKHVAGKGWRSGAAKSEITSTPYQARKQINFDKGGSELEGHYEEFWNEFKDIFLSDHWFEKIVFKKYQEYFVIRFGELAESENFLGHFRKKLFLQQHDPGYYIGPHTDIPTRVFTCIFAFADRDGFEEYGTEISVHKDPLVRCWGNNHYTPEDFVVKKLAPYKPNNFFLFFKTRQSFHSVKAIDETVPNRRYGMQFQFYEPSGGLFTDLSEPDLLKTELRKDLKTKIRQIWSIVKYVWFTPSLIGVLSAWPNLTETIFA